MALTLPFARIRAQLIPVAHFVILDGSTHLVDQSIDWRVMRALLTPNGREAESADAFQ